MVIFYEYFTIFSPKSPRRPTMNLNSAFDQVAADVAASYSPIATMNWEPKDPEDELSKSFFEQLEYDQFLDDARQELQDEGYEGSALSLNVLDRAADMAHQEMLSRQDFASQLLRAKAKAQEDRLAAAIAVDTVTTSLPGTIIQPTLERTLSLSPELLTSVFSQRSGKLEPSTFKVSFPSPIRELSELSQSCVADGTSTKCVARSSKRSTTAPRKRRVMPVLFSALPRRELDRFVQAQLAADQIWLQLSKLSKEESLSETLLTNTLSSTSTTTEVSNAQLDSFPNLEISRPPSTGITDPLEAARAELRAMRLLLRTGKIQLTSGGTVIKGSRML